MGFLGGIARGIGEVAGFESASTYDLKLVVQADTARDAEANAKAVLKSYGLHRGQIGPGGVRRMFTQYVAFGFAAEVNGRGGFTLTHEKSLKEWQRMLRDQGHPENVPIPFEVVGEPDYVDPNIGEQEFYDGRTWIVDAWLGRQFPHIGPLSL